MKGVAWDGTTKTIVGSLVLVQFHQLFLTMVLTARGIVHEVRPKRAKREFIRHQKTEHPGGGVKDAAAESR